MGCLLLILKYTFLYTKAIIRFIIQKIDITTSIAGTILKNSPNRVFCLLKAVFSFLSVPEKGKENEAKMKAKDRAAFHIFL